MTLHSTCPLEIFLSSLQKPGGVRAFAFDVELAVGSDAAEVDAESGMLVNLVQLDAYLAHLQQHWRGRVPAAALQEVLMESLQRLLIETERDGVPLRRLCFYEKRGWHFGWEQGLFCGQRQWLETTSGVYTIETVSVWSGVDGEVGAGAADEVGAEVGKEAQLKMDDALNAGGIATAKSILLEVLAKNPSLLRVRVQNAVSRETWEQEKK